MSSPGPETGMDQATINQWKPERPLPRRTTRLELNWHASASDGVKSGGGRLVSTFPSGVYSPTSHVCHLCMPPRTLYHTFSEGNTTLVKLLAQAFRVSKYWEKKGLLHLRSKRAAAALAVCPARYNGSQPPALCKQTGLGGLAAHQSFVFSLLFQEIEFTFPGDRRSTNVTNITSC